MAAVSAYMAARNILAYLGIARSGGLGMAGLAYLRIAGSGEPGVATRNGSGYLGLAASNP